MYVQLSEKLERWCYSSARSCSSSLIIAIKVGTMIKTLLIITKWIIFSQMQNERIKTEEHIEYDSDDSSRWCLCSYIFLYLFHVVYLVMAPLPPPSLHTINWSRRSTKQERMRTLPNISKSTRIRLVFNWWTNVVRIKIL